jgi:hypothetical protein
LAINLYYLYLSNLLNNDLLPHTLYIYSVFKEHLRAIAPS